MAQVDGLENAVVLESDMFSTKKGSEWEDSSLAYPFPARYLREIDSLITGEPALAVIYEPRGRQNAG